MFIKESRYVAVAACSELEGVVSGEWSNEKTQQILLPKPKSSLKFI